MRKLIFVFSVSIISTFSFGQNDLKQEKAVEEKPEGPKEILKFVDEPAEYPGGIGQLKLFLSQNLVYPPTALEKGIQGKCYVKFKVSESGEIDDIKIMRGVMDCPQCDEEAIRVIKLMPKWIPGKMDGKSVASYYNLPISFKLADPVAPKKD